MIDTKLVQKFGNSGHIILPKEYVGKRVKFILKLKSFEDIKFEVLEILKPYLENILGVYLYGSYARNEQTFGSDIDILVVTNTKLKIIRKVDEYSIVSVTLKEVETILETDAILVLPILKEAKTIINPDLLERYKQYKLTKKNTKLFIDSSRRILELNKKGLKLDFELGSLVYSLILRIRGLLTIRLMINNKLYSKSSLFNYLKNNDLINDKVNELYKIYSNERNGIKVKESNIVKKEDILKLIIIAENLLQELIR